MKTLYDKSCDIKSLMMNNTILVEKFYNTEEVSLIRTDKKIRYVKENWLYGFRVTKLKTKEQKQAFRLLMYSKYGIS